MGRPSAKPSSPRRVEISGTVRLEAKHLVADGRDLRLQRSPQRLGKHDDAILLALALTHDDDLAIEVDVFDSQAQAFHQAEPCAVEKAGNRRTTFVYRDK